MKTKSDFLRMMFILVVVFLGGQLNAFAAKKMWVQYNGSNRLTFYYTEKSSLGTNEFWVNNNVTKQSDCTWNTGNDDTKMIRQSVRAAIFDPSFAEARPKTCAWWFDSFTHLVRINGAEYFNTSEVTDMQHMFFECSALVSDDYHRYVDFSHFDTRKVKNMSGMFGWCEKIELLDLSSFDTHNVTDLSIMFYGCEKVQTIYVGDGFVVNSGTNTKSMFWNCLKLKGEIAYCDETGKYATADGGYFIDRTKYRPWVKYDNGKLTFQYGYKHTLKENEYDLNTDKNVPGWESQNPNVTTVVFDKTFAQVRPTSCYYWFHGCNQLDNRNILGLDYLNTSEVKIFRDMFWNCAKFERLDLSSFNTEKCEDMAGMFNACSNLFSLNIPNFKTDNVTDMKYMFYDCKTIWSLDLTNFNTSKVTAMDNMFYNCSKLKTIYVGNNFTTSKVQRSENMFYGCSKLEGNIQWNANNAKDKTYASTDGYFTDKSIDEKPWVQFDKTSGKLSFRYTRKKTINNTTEFTLNTGQNDPAWLKFNKDVKNVYIEPNFYYARPTSTWKWFYGCNQLTINNFIDYCLYKINLSEVTTMDYMFANCTKLDKLELDATYNTTNLKSMRYFVSGCTSLWRLWLNKFNTNNLIDMSYAFADCKMLTQIDITSFNTENVKNMEGMFKGCISKSSIDLSNFDTHNVTNMSYMFSGCSALKSLKLSSFNTANVTNMSRLFENCSSLDSLDVSNFNTANVTTAPSMFNGCSSLKTIDISNFNTAKIDNMGHMFANCSNLTKLDLTNFNTSAAKWVDNMFKDCSNLTTIYASDLFTLGSNVQNSTGMFTGCEKLVGAIAYDANFVDKTYAKADGGYFIDKVYTRPWVKYADGTLTFQYGYKKILKSNEYLLNTNKNIPDWESQNSNVNKVVFDQSFADIRPTSCYYWFHGCKQLDNNNIIGLNYLNTENVTSMAYMFSDCSVLKSLNLSNFNTANVTDMMRLFENCSSLDSLDLSNFNTANLTTAPSMFNGCTNLKTVNVSSFNTAKLDNMGHMFASCSSLTTLDLTNFNTNKVTSLENMFYNCSNLKTIYVSNNFTTAKVTNSNNMFTNCQKLVGAIAYDANFEDKTYAKVDGGYFSDKVFTRPWVKYSNGTLIFQYGYKKTLGDYEYTLNEERLQPRWHNIISWIKKVVFDNTFAYARPTSCYHWFSYSNLSNIEGIENLNTSECTNMAYMFYYCYGPKSLDLSNFDTRKVTYMDDMLYGFNSLKSIYISDKFVGGSTEVFAPSSSVFYCNPSQYNTTKANPIFAECTVKPYVNINSKAEYGTICVPLGSSLAEGSFSGFDKLYTIKSADKDKGTITMVEATTIEPGVAYVYRRNLPEGDTESIITFDADNSATATEPKTEDCLLKGTFSRITAPGGCYILQSDGNFHPVAADNTTLGVGAYKAYLDLSSLDIDSENAKNFQMVFEDKQATGIKGVSDQADMKPMVYFDLMGRRVATPRIGGIYIVNGKKVMYKN